MANFEIKEDPQFSSTMRKHETTDKAHADLFNTAYETLLDNDNYLKKQAEKQWEEADEKYGRIVFGPEETEISGNDVLFILDDDGTRIKQTKKRKEG